MINKMRRDTCAEMRNILKKVAIHNLGCKVNSYEAESMELMLSRAGYEIVSFDDNIPADVYIINTCSVTNIADRKSRQMLHKAKKMNPDAVVIAAGCYVQADEDGVKRDEAVDIVIGNNMKINIVDVLDEYYKDKSHYDYVLDINNKETKYEELKIDKVSEHTRAYIKIQDGCNQFCSYCIIPYTRGRIRSRQACDVVDEVKRLAANGYKEVVLTGIHLTSYGKDTGKETLLDVIKMVHNVTGIERIRLGSLEPRIITDEFVSEISRLKKVCPHFHLSLQSGCDKTLKAMNRKYTSEEYLRGCNVLRKYYANPAITTDVIVGFPEETDEDFETTKAFVKKVHFYEMHIFKFSRRKGTVADQMTNQVDDRIKTKRSNELIELEESMSLDYRKLFEGSVMEVLIEEKQLIDGKQYYTGYTMNYIRVIVPAEQLDNDINEVVNNIYKVKCSGLDATGKYMYGDIIN